LGGANQADRALLDQVEEGQSLVAVALGDRDDEAEVRLDHLLLRPVVAALDALCELDLLRRREQVDLADVLEEELERVARDLEGERDRLFALVRLLLGGIEGVVRLEFGLLLKLVVVLDPLLLELRIVYDDSRALVLTHRRLPGLRPPPERAGTVASAPDGRH